MAFDDAIRAYYDLSEEQGRLGDWGRLELIRTQELLERHLPPTSVTLACSPMPTAARMRRCCSARPST